MKSPPKMPLEAGRVREMAATLTRAAGYLEDGNLGAACGDLDAVQRALLGLSLAVGMTLGAHKERCDRGR